MSTLLCQFICVFLVVLQRLIYYFVVPEAGNVKALQFDLRPFPRLSTVLAVCNLEACRRILATYCALRFPSRVRSSSRCATSAHHLTSDRTS
jgi:hypothetical protein